MVASIRCSQSNRSSTFWSNGRSTSVTWSDGAFTREKRLWMELAPMATGDRVKLEITILMLHGTSRIEQIMFQSLNKLEFNKSEMRNPVKPSCSKAPWWMIKWHVWTSNGMPIYSTNKLMKSIILQTTMVSREAVRHKLWWRQRMLRISKKSKSIMNPGIISTLYIYILSRWSDCSGSKSSHRWKSTFA